MDIVSSADDLSIILDEPITRWVEELLVTEEVFFKPGISAFRKGIGFLELCRINSGMVSPFLCTVSKQLLLSALLTC